MSPLPALLVTVTLLGGYAAARLHAAVREAERELRAADRRLDPSSGPGPGRALDDELHSLAEVAGAERDSRWRWSAAVMVVLSLVAVAAGVWALTGEPSGLDAFSITALALAPVLVTVLFVLDAERIAATLAAAVRRSPLQDVRRLEDALAAVDRADPEPRPAPVSLAYFRSRARRRAAARRAAAAQRLRHTEVDLATVAARRVRFPAGYVDGLRGLLPLLGGRLDDASWEAALAHLGRAAELDEPRRTRWLSTLAACAELRDDPPARESAARWALDAAAVERTHSAMSRPPDALSDSIGVRPVRPETWEGALRRARTVGAPSWLLARVTVRWARTMAADLEPPVAAAVEIVHELPPPAADAYLGQVRPAVEALGATSDQMARLVPPRRVPPPHDPRGPEPPARHAAKPAGATAADPPQT